MWAQEHELRASRSWLAGVAKGIPIGLMFVILAAGSAFCQAAPTPDSSSEKSAPPAFRRQASVRFGREAHATALSARASSPQISSQEANGPGASKTTAQMPAASAPCTESISRGRHALEISPHNDSVALTLARDLARCGQLNEAVSHYRQYLQTHPEAEDTTAELGDTLLRAQQPADAMEVFRALLSSNPQSLDAHFGLARALARRGNYPEALRHYEVMLTASPEHGDALQGKAFVLYWSGQLAPAKALFQRLLAVQPNDPENRAALKRIGEAEEASRWEALRPGADAPPGELRGYYEKRLASYPDDLEALLALARAQALLKNLPAAIQQYKRLLAIKPRDHRARMELAQLLCAEGQYQDSAKFYRSVLDETPDDASALEGLAWVYVKSNRWREARPLFETLIAKQADRLDYQLELARVQMNLQDYAAAREVLVTLLSTNPHNEDAQAQLAQLELKQNHFRSAARQFDQLLKQNPKHVEARLGRARVAYYLNDLSTAQRLATDLVTERPEDFDAVFLLTQVEHARRHRGQALSLVQQAKQLAPADPEVEQLEKRIHEQANFKLRTTASYAREIGQPSSFGKLHGTGSEDLRMSGFGTTFEFAFLPRTTSYLSLTYLPSNSPAGGIRGAAGPAQWLYRQDTQLTSRLTLRGGVGAVRFGPGGLQNVPQQSDPIPTEPIPTATIKALGFAGVSYAPHRNYSFDLEGARNAISYTPLSARLGVMENRASARLNYFLGSRTELHVEYFFATYSSIQYDHVRIVNSSPVREHYADHDRAHGGTVTLIRNLARREHFRFDAGYEGMGYTFAGARRQIWLGFFNPSFYARYQLLTHFEGTFWKPLGYDFVGNIGLQQIEQGQPLTRAMTLSPTLTYKVNERLTLGLGYTHYNSTQTLGTVRGDAVRFTTERSF